MGHLVIFAYLRIRLSDQATRGFTNEVHTKNQYLSPNITVKRASTKLMASPISWTLLMPYTRFAPSGAVYLGR